MNSFYKKIHKLFSEQYPSTEHLLPSWPIGNILSPLTIELPTPVLHTAQSAIQTLYQLSKNPDYQRSITHTPAKILTCPARNDSILMAYDFHYQNNKLSLIEVNTNASGYLLAQLLLQAHEDRQFSGLAQLQNSFTAEADLFGLKEPLHIAILDQDILKQRMYIEFLMYRDLLNSWGYNAHICEVSDLFLKEDRLADQNGTVFNFIYNRWTDFYFQSPAAQDLKTAYLNQVALFSPQPKTYALLADKNRLIELSQPQALSRYQLTDEQVINLNNVLLPTHLLADFADTDDLWSQRKNYFFKPTQSHGGKQVYRGASISRTNFNRLMETPEHFLVQTLAPPGVFQDQASATEWKYDLRFYVYQDQVQQVIARIYQGQVTNFSTPGGGFARVLFS